ncbi:MAG: hypothetical protein ACOYPS_12475 [Phycisphaerales bacterium]
MNHHSLRICDTHAAISRRLLEACAMLGLGVRPVEPPPLPLPPPPHALEAALALAPGAHLHISGESASGKSSLLLAAERALHLAGHATQRVASPSLRSLGRRSVIDLFDGPVDHAMATLACAGLAEGPLLASPARLLSEGQRWRLGLALAMHRLAAAPPSQRRWLLADEFVASLDARTARWVCHATSRWASREGISIIACGTWDAPARWLAARRLVLHARGSRRSAHLLPHATACA